MCYNKESSIAAYVVGMILSYNLYKGDSSYKTVALFCFTFIQIQLAEFLMWVDYDCRKSLNRIGTVFSEIVLYLQPVSIILGLLYYKSSIISSNYLKLALVITLIPVFKILIKNIKNRRKLCTRKAKDTHNLDWDYPSPKWDKSNIVIYHFFLFIPWLFLKDRVKGTILFFLLTITLHASKLNFYQWESRWCVLGTVIPFIFSVMKKFAKY